MSSFLGTPISPLSADSEHALFLDGTGVDPSTVANAIAENKLVLVRRMPFGQAPALFRRLCERYGLRDSYDLQMQFIVHSMKDRAPAGDGAVTVNDRGPLQFIQAHAEGNSTSQLDLFALHCTRNAEVGGENIMSLVDQSADHSTLRAKEKATVGSGLSPKELGALRGTEHLDAKEVLPACPSECHVLKNAPRGKIIVRKVPIRPAKSAITGADVVTYWDNVTAHDHAFHRHQYELLRHLGIFHQGTAERYESYMHVEDDSPWKPADTDSGDLQRTASLFARHYVYKMASDEVLLFNNRTWTHSVNNWAAGQTRKLTAMYA
jgi:hypothetical protein